MRLYAAWNINSLVYITVGTEFSNREPVKHGGRPKDEGKTMIGQMR